MGAFGGPNLSEDGLVFYYDTGNVLKSYKGEPTTNVIAGTNLVNVVAGTFTTNTTVGGVRILENTQVNNSHVMWNGATGFIVTCSAGAYITVSAEYKTTCTIRMRFRDNPYDSQYDIDGGNIATISETSVDIPNTQGKWVKYSLTAQTTTANPDLWWYLADYRPNNQFGKVEIRNWQIEVKSHPTPYVNGTRSTTQGLIDLTGNSTIDLTNVSFDSNAQMTFDGTNDGIDINSIYSGSTENSVTVEGIVALSTNQTSRIFISNYTQVSTPTGFGIGINDSLTNRVKWFTGNLGTTNTLTSTTTLVNNQYYHVVGTYNGSLKVLYINGVQEASATISNAINNTSTVASIGYLRYLSNQRLIGELPLARIYNRALTASEVAANFNGIRSRFNI